MNLEAITNVVEIIAAVAVIFSLVYVGKEISQNNRNQRLLALQSHNEAFRENIAIAAAYSETWVAGLDNYPQMSASENARFGFVIHASFRHIEQAHLLHKEGVLPDETYRKSMRLICSLCAYPGGRNWCASRKIHFNADFVTAVEAIIADDALMPMYDFDIAATEQQRPV
jgi:hypothetical protein